MTTNIDVCPPETQRTEVETSTCERSDHHASENLQEPY
jgi:hypothetical protein